MQVGTRLQALDVFRGFTLASMIFVNFPGSSEAIWNQLRHGEWTTTTFADLIFPYFLFIIGISLALSYEKAKTAGTPPRKLWRKAITRGVALYLLGFIIASIAAGEISFRLGTLQRIGIVYLLAFPFTLLPSRKIVTVSASLFIIYLLFICQLRAPNIPWELRWEEGSTFAEYVDLAILGKPKAILFSFFGAVVSILLGVVAGRMTLYLPMKALLSRFIALGVSAILFSVIVSIGAFRTAFWYIPLYPKLWTPSVIALAIGTALLLLAALLYLVDEKKILRPWIPFLALGLNPLAVYLFTDLLDALVWKIFAVGGTRKSAYLFLTPTFGEAAASYFIALLYLAAGLGLASYLYRRGIMIRL